MKRIAGIRIRPRVEISYVLVALTPLLLLGLWPSPQARPPLPESTRGSPRFVYVQHSETVMDPTVIAAPGIHLEFSQESQSGVDQPRQRPASSSLPAATLARLGAAEPLSDTPALPLADRAAGALPRPFFPMIPTPAHELRSAPAPMDELEIVTLGALAGARPMIPEVPASLFGAEPWSITCTLTVAADGRVTDAIVPPPATGSIPVAYLSAWLHRLHFDATTTPCDGQVRVRYTPAGP